MKLLMTAYKQNLEPFNQPFGIIGLILTHISTIIVLTPFSTIHQIVKTITPPNDNVNCLCHHWSLPHHLTNYPKSNNHDNHHPTYGFQLTITTRKE